jgi:hypothetical protein
MRPKIKAVFVRGRDIFALVAVTCEEARLTAESDATVPDARIT